MLNVCNNALWIKGVISHFVGLLCCHLWFSARAHPQAPEQGRFNKHDFQTLWSHRIQIPACARALNYTLDRDHIRPFTQLSLATTHWRANVTFQQAEMSHRAIHRHMLPSKSVRNECSTVGNNPPSWTKIVCNSKHLVSEWWESLLCSWVYTVMIAANTEMFLHQTFLLHGTRVHTNTNWGTYVAPVPYQPILVSLSTNHYHLTQFM